MPYINTKLFELKQQIDIFDKQLNDLKPYLAKYANFATPANYDDEKAKMYYSYRKQYSEIQMAQAKVIRKFIEIQEHQEQQATDNITDYTATERYITSGIYERAMKRTQKAVLSNMGY